MARSPYGDADAIDAVARRCEHEANRLDDAANRWVRSIGSARWQCARADRTRSEIGGSARGLHRDAAELRRLASELRSHAATVRLKTAARDRAERDSRRILDGHDPRFTPIRRPAPGSTDWLNVRDQVRRLGGGI